ncbi:Capsule biosynthesis protein CapB [Novipirellula aureliae]|uniref:Capsule biosynthesis protein CapB n=1 Tax=Novipirellula aureliae TaxID=2527966 RepID=A0A5C6DW67_9BACT|nr:poly-gamma-glutamate synthase PgsB [Novipirellula aureliae]TWU39069.1 Capsule biosynthesis protein CapB [Novipirellula aureliae]
MDGSLALLSTTGTLVGLGLLESYFHRRQLAKIPTRIHVNGTRGKSSVTRLIAAGLRASGTRTCAKTTGTLARMILPDGAEYPVFRPARANVIEQVRIVRAAAEAESEALVIECMALIPYLQWLCEFMLVHATHSVITNARADHLDVMGPGEKDVAWALLGMVPKEGKLYTAERRHLDAFHKVCDDRKTELITVGDEEVDAILPLEMAQFSYIEHAENVALALRVLHDLGVERSTALQGMWSATPDPGIMTVADLNFFGREISFVNGFAANDPESTERIWNMACDRYANVTKRIMIFNCRFDRPDRSKQLAECCAQWKAADHYVLIGSGTYIFAKFATRAGLDPRKLVMAEGDGADEIFEKTVSLCGRSALVMGMANIGGVGLDVVRYFRNRGIADEKAF